MDTTLVLLAGLTVGGCLFTPVDPLDEEADAGAADDEAMDDGMAGDAADVEYCAPTLGWDGGAVALEARVVELVNQARARGGTCATETFAPSAPLTSEAALTCAARVHSLDMSTRAFFDHVNPDGVDPFDRMSDAGYDYVAAAENIAAGQSTAEQVVDGWLASPGHCRNILNPEFTQIGVGYVFNAASFYPYFWTQTFGTPG